MQLRSPRACRLSALLALGLALAPIARAEPRTLTDQFGRTIKADVLAVQGDNVKIRREDGQTFDLPLSTLCATDQEALANWTPPPGAPAPAKPATPAKPEATAKPLTPASLSLALSRGKFGSNSLYRYAGYSHAHEQWGYNIQVTNTTLHPIANVRVEYNLFARKFADMAAPQPIADAQTIAKLEPKVMSSFRTRTAEVCRHRSMGWGNSGGELRGVWVRVYVGRELLVEQVMPESLRTTETWTAPR